MSEDFEKIKLSRQLGFPLYACAKEVVRKYQSFLDELDLTYTQYITMLSLWECPESNVKELGKRLRLDSGTLTPLLKKLESKQYIIRRRSYSDGRNLMISLTDKGLALREKGMRVPGKVGECIPISSEDAVALHKILNEILEFLERSGEICE